MTTTANYYKVGIFVIMAVIIAILALVVLGADVLLKQRIVVETYLDQSVQGLDIGSAVRYRGVQVGNIKTIDFVYNYYREAHEEGLRYVLIRMNIDPKPFGLEDARKLLYDALQPEIENGLRVRMRPQGITGAFYVELDYVDTERFTFFQPEWVPEYPYIPSVPSTISRISDSFEKILSKFENMELGELFTNLNDVLMELKTGLSGARLAKLHDEASELIAKAGKQIDDLQFAKLHNETSNLIADIKKSNEHLQTILTDPKIEKLLTDASTTVEGAKEIVDGEDLARIMQNLKEASESLSSASQRLEALTSSGDLEASLTHFRKTLSRLDRIVLNQQRNFELIVENLARSSQEIKELINDARKYPSGFFFGEPPKRNDIKVRP
ncbi:MAG: MlaD family protein [Candidatus Sumerlaeia bacterium]